jgi:hypothetical protein
MLVIEESELYEITRRFMLGDESTNGSRPLHKKLKRLRSEAFTFLDSLIELLEFTFRPVYPGKERTR